VIWQGATCSLKHLIGPEVPVTEHVKLFWLGILAQTDAQPFAIRVRQKQADVRRTISDWPRFITKTHIRDLGRMPKKIRQLARQAIADSDESNGIGLTDQVHPNLSRSTGNKGLTIPPALISDKDACHKCQSYQRSDDL
jgi:hypothetical protein